MANLTDKFSAGAQGLGYIYQVRLALLRLLQLPENTAVSLEKDDDLDFVDSGGGKSLVSLKHKSNGDRLTDLSIDFWTAGLPLLQCRGGYSRRLFPSAAG